VAERAPQLELEYRFLLQDGYRWLYGVTRLVYDDQGELADTLGYVMDVTERRQADQAVREREATLQAVVNASPDIITIPDADGGIRSMSPAVQRILGHSSDERVGRSAFSSDIIHPDDLERFTQAQRRVLTGQADHAAVRLRARHADGHWLTLEIASRLLAAPAGVLLVSRDVTEQAALEEELALADVAAETVSLIRPMADQHSIILIGPEVLCATHVLGDRQRLKQVLLNLLSNAVKYNREGGSVHLTCEPVAGERLRIKVTDTGLGIPPESVERLFVPFERVGSERSAIEGTGLGLPLSKRLAEAMGGTLELASTPYQGSTFWIELPLVEGPVQQDEGQARVQAGPAEEQAERPGPTLTVLYIEDNLSNLRLVERVLGRRPGVRLISAMRPQLGLDLAADHRPDLVLLDLHLPDMPGEAVLRRLQTGPRTAGIPVVILSADARPGLIQRLLEQGRAAS
jgi:PAS domain S-box-containing protein